MNKKRQLFVYILFLLFVFTAKPSVAFADEKLPWPTDTKHTYKGGFGLYSGHNGMDITAPNHTVLYSPLDGVANFYQRYRAMTDGNNVLVSYGNYAEIISSDKKTKIMICHMSEFYKVSFKLSNLVNAKDYWKSYDNTLSVASWKAGDKEVLCGSRNVHVGDIIGYSGGTGRSTGPHLHVTLYINKNFKTPVDPINYFNQKLSAKDKAKRVTIQGANNTIYIGYNGTFSATTNESGSTIFWESSNSSVVAVDQNGAYTGLSKGKAVISAFLKDENGKKIESSKDSRTITVKDVIVTLSKTAISLYPGQDYLLPCTLKGKPLGKKIKWSSSDNSIAQILNQSDNKYGAITAKSVGTCTITAKIGASSATCKVTVKKPTIKLDKSTLSLSQGNSYSLKATVQGATKTVTWSTSDKTIATVESGKVLAKKAGTATIIAKANGVTAKCKVTVKKAKVSITLSPTSKTIYVGDSFTIKATVKGSTSKVTWSSSNTSIVSVSSSGKATGKKAGSATITAKVGGKTAKCNVTVNAKSSNSGGSGGGCVTPETMISLADGSQKRVDELKDTDIIKVYDFDNGMVTNAAITLFHRVKEEEQVLRVVFSDGTSIGVVKDHCFFDLTNRCFVTIYTENQADELAGHMFAMLKDDEISEVELIDIRKEGKTDSYYAPVSEVHLNCFANGLLSMPGYVKGFCNVFELEENELKYDAVKKAEEIRIVSESKADGFSIITNLGVFKKNKLDWIRVSVAKGMISVEELKDLYVFCLPFFVN